MDFFDAIALLCIFWIVIGFVILATILDGLNKHKFEIASAIVLLWPILIIVCGAVLIFSVIIGAFKGFYYILIGFIKQGDSKD